MRDKPVIEEVPDEEMHLIDLLDDEEEEDDEEKSE
jgi:hypothetical protein